MRVPIGALLLGIIVAGPVFADSGHGSGSLEMLNIGEAMGVTNPNVPKFKVLRSTVDVGHFETGSSEGEPTAVISVAVDKDGKRATDDGTGKPKPAQKDPNDGKAQIDDKNKNTEVAKVEPNTRPFSAANSDGKPALAVAQYDESGNVKTVTLKDGAKVDFTGKGLTDADIDRWLKDPNNSNLVGNNGVVRPAMSEGSGGGRVTCQG